MTSSVAVDSLFPLRSSPLFRVLPDDELRAIAAHLLVEQFQAGATIIREGEPGDTCYVIRSGEAGVVSRDLIGQEVTLTVFGPGQSFGEIALVNECCRTA